MHLNTLDLHGIKHDRVADKVINFINCQDPPFRIITGKSDKMREIVLEILDNNKYFYYDEHFYNYGCLVVTEACWW